MPLLCHPQVMVSNPHSLGLQAVIYEDGYTYDGNTKHRLVSLPPCPRPLGERRGPTRSRRLLLSPSACPSFFLLPILFFF